MSKKIIKIVLSIILAAAFVYVSHFYEKGIGDEPYYDGLPLSYLTHSYQCFKGPNIACDPEEYQAVGYKVLYPGLLVDYALFFLITYIVLNLVIRPKKQ